MDKKDLLAQVFYNNSDNAKNLLGQLLLDTNSTGLNPLQPGVGIPLYPNTSTDTIKGTYWPSLEEQERLKQEKEQLKMGQAAIIGIGLLKKGLLKVKTSEEFAEAVEIIAKELS